MEWEIELLADQPLGQKLIKKGFWLYLFTFLIAPAGYIIKVIISNELSVADVGIFYSVLGFVTIISLYNDLGLTEALQYFLPKYRIEKEYHKVKTISILTWIIQFISWILISGWLYLASNRLAIHYFHSPESVHIIRLFCLYFFWINFVQVFSSFFVAFQDTFNQLFIDFIRNYVTLGFTLIFRLGNIFTLSYFTWAWLVWVLISIICWIFIFLKKYKKVLTLWTFNFDKALVKKQLKYARRVFLGTNAGILFGQISQQIAIYFLWPEAAGYYANYYALFMTYGVIVWPILWLIFPIATELITKKDHEKLALLQDMLYKYLLIFAVAIAWIFFAFGPEIAIILFGTKFYYSWVLVSYTAPFLLLNILISINYWILAGLGKIKDRVKILWLALLINIIVNFICILVFHIGLLWPILWVIIWRSILRYFSFKIVDRNQKITLDRKYLIKNISIIWIVMIVFFFIKEYFFIINNVYRFHNLIYLAIAMFIYFAILWWSNYVSIKNAIQEIKKMMR